MPVIAVAVVMVVWHVATTAVVTSVLVVATRAPHFTAMRFGTPVVPLAARGVASPPAAIAVGPAASATSMMTAAAMIMIEPATDR